MVSIQFINNHAGFLLTIHGKRIFIDPAFIDSKYEPIDASAFTSTPADGILITHPHGDHMRKESIQEIMGEKTEIVCPKSCVKDLREFNPKGVTAGDNFIIAGINVSAFPSYNIGKKFHPKQNGWLGYLIAAKQFSLYFSGDTDVIPEMDDLYGQVDIAFLHVGGTYTMDFEEGVKAAQIIHPRMVVPIHFWDNDPMEFEKLIMRANFPCQVKILDSRPWTPKYLGNPDENNPMYD